MAHPDVTPINRYMKIQGACGLNDLSTRQLRMKDVFQDISDDDAIALYHAFRSLFEEALVVTLLCRYPIDRCKIAAEEAEGRIVLLQQACENQLGRITSLMIVGQCLETLFQPLPTFMAALKNLQDLIADPMQRIIFLQKFSKYFELSPQAVRARIHRGVTLKSCQNHLPTLQNMLITGAGILQMGTMPPPPLPRVVTFPARTVKKGAVDTTTTSPEPLSLERTRELQDFLEEIRFTPSNAKRLIEKLSDAAARHHVSIDEYLPGFWNAGWRKTVLARLTKNALLEVPPSQLLALQTAMQNVFGLQPGQAIHLITYYPGIIKLGIHELMNRIDDAIDTREPKAIMHLFGKASISIIMLTTEELRRRRLILLGRGISAAEHPELLRKAKDFKESRVVDDPEPLVDSRSPLSSIELRGVLLRGLGWEEEDVVAHLKVFPFLEEIDADVFHEGMETLRNHLDIGDGRFTRYLTHELPKSLMRLDQLRALSEGRKPKLIEDLAPEIKRWVMACHRILPINMRAAQATLEGSGFTPMEAALFLARNPALLAFEGGAMNLYTHLLRHAEDSNISFEVQKKLLLDSRERAILFERNDFQAVANQSRLREYIRAMNEHLPHLDADLLDFLHGWSRIYFPATELGWRLFYVYRVAPFILTETVRTLHAELFTPSRADFINEVRLLMVT